MNVLQYTSAVLVIMACPAIASSTCAPRDIVVDQLTNHFGETRQSIGLSSGNVMMEIYASDQTGSWTITATNPSGETCLMAAGQSYETLRQSLPAKGQDL